MSGSGLPYLPPEIKRLILSFVDDIDIRRHFRVYSRIPRDDPRVGVLLKRPTIKQVYGQYHPTSGSAGIPYGEVVIPAWQPAGDLHVTVKTSRGRVVWEDFFQHPYKGTSLHSRFYL